MSRCSVIILAGAETVGDFRALRRQFFLTLRNQSADTILTFVLMMIRQPEIAVKAQAEIDRVIGDDQLPELKDRPDIPYVDCILKEVLRYQFYLFKFEVNDF